MSNIILFLCLVLSFSVMSAEVDLVKITNEEDKAISVMFLEVDEDKNIIAFGKKVFKNGVQSLKRIFPGKLDYAGIVVERRKKRDLIVLKSLNLDDKNGGALEVSYLFNGLSQSRKQIVLELGRTSDSWQLSSKGRIVRSLHLVSNKKLFFGTVGIKEILIK